LFNKNNKSVRSYNRNKLKKNKMTKLLNNKSQRRKICKCLYNKRNNELIIDFIYFIVIKIYIENYIKNIYFFSF